MEVVSTELYPSDHDDGETPLITLPEHAGLFACAQGTRRLPRKRAERRVG
jgi:hypothetical protein